MAWTSASLESILATILAVLFAIAGVVNLAGRGAVKSDFARWGYPAWFRLLCGALELVSAALLLGQQTRVLGLTLTAGDHDRSALHAATKPGAIPASRPGAGLFGSDCGHFGCPRLKVPRP
ncbi:DoxX family protein [Pseudomonas sp. NA-150]|uniref:DoxX family protein n=1 Tax=Pseudomonas sp. NA-150 TaxID=3367525 RepID=UPI0037C9D29A